MLSSFLNRHGHRDLIGQFVLLSDALSDGGFLLHHFLTQALKDDHLMYLVSFAQSFTHYSSVAAKLGVNLTKLQQKGEFVFVDCMTKLLSHLWEEKEEHAKGVQDRSDDVSKLTFSIDRDFSLCRLYQMLRDSVASLRQDRPVCLIIDDISVLLSVGVGVAEVVSLVHYCQQLLCSPDGLCKGEGYLVTMVHCEGGDGSEGEEEVVRTHLLHRSHLTLHVEGLPTGYSKEVHGELTAEWRSPEHPSLCTTRKHTQFKLSDRTVQLFAKGTSRAVL